MIIAAGIDVLERLAIPIGIGIIVANIIISDRTGSN